jgi:Beta-lactamase enzyme family
MLSRTPLPRRFLPIAVAVFLLGAGVGVLIVARTNQAARREVTVERVVTGRTRIAAAPRAKQVVRPTRRRVSSTGLGASFAALERQLPGSVGLAVAPLGAGPIESWGNVDTAHAWSTSKVPVLVTLLRDYEKRGQPLGSQDRSDAALALEESDNSAIDALFAELEQIHGGLVPASAAMQRVLRASGDDTTTINTLPNDQGFTTEGQTEWPVSREVTFYRALARGCLLDSADTGYVLGLMRSVIPSQRWGAGAAGYPANVPLAFKGGWGPVAGGAYQVRQTAIVGSGTRGYVLSLLALPSSGAFSDGVQMASALAVWAREHFRLSAAHAPASCAGRLDRARSPLSEGARQHQT